MEIVIAEQQDGTIDPVAMAKAVGEARGNIDAANAIYPKFRMDRIKDELEEAELAIAAVERAAREAEKKEAKAKAKQNRPWEDQSTPDKPVDTDESEGWMMLAVIVGFLIVSFGLVLLVVVP